jgi:GTP-binding protein HflX
VGFIRELPRDLVAAFKATLEELADADLLLHVADLSSPHLESQLVAVEKILEELHLDHIPRLLVLNKIDRVDALEAANQAVRYGAVPISALDPKTLMALVERIEETLWKEAPAKSGVPFKPSGPAAADFRE